MKIVLINPPIWNDLGKVLASTPPLGLLFLAGYLEKNNYSDIKVVDADALKMTWQDLEDLFKKEQPDIVGVTGPSFVLPALFKTVELVKKILPKTKIITGGYGSTVEPEKVLKHKNGLIDFIVMNEGEITFLELVKAIESKQKDFNKINGLAYLEKNKAIFTQKRDFIMDLDSIPWPAYHFLTPGLLEYRGLHADYKEMPRPHGILFASRGCPHRCAFCSLGRKIYRARSPKDIVDEMEFYKNKFGIRSIQVYDDELIGMSPQQNKWITELCNEIISRGLNKKMTFLGQGRCSRYIKLETLKKMRQAGFVWIWWGVESGSQKILDFITKDIKVENVYRTFDLAKKAGLKSMMFIMVGFPKETQADIKLTAKIIKEVKPDEVRIHIVSPYPGSKLREYFEEHNLLETDDYYRFDSRKNVIHHTDEMTAGEIKKNFRLLVFRFENGYWYFIKFFIKSLLSLDGWKKLGKRAHILIEYFSGWVKISSS